MLKWDMKKSIKKTYSKRLAESVFEQIDHRIACGWHVDMDESNVRKKYSKTEDEHARPSI